MPKPFPLYEIFVYSPQMEGIHLRGGMISRGGIRWSDRREDFRTEVLGLMKAQMVKNAVIVPVGSKGGFVLRSVPSDRAQLQAEVRRQYRRSCAACSTSPTTSSRGQVVQPAGVRCYDGDDPYLVVAADKGTAHALGRRQRDRDRLRLLARRRVRLGRVERLRPQGARRSPPAAPGRA